VNVKALVLGAGMMGRAIAYDIARAKGVDEVVLGDISLKVAKDVAKWAGMKNIRPVKADVSKPDSIKKLMKGMDVAVGAVSYRFNVALSRAAIACKVNFNDLGGNNTVVQNQLALCDKALKAGITIVPDCGLAPGMVALLVARAVEKLGTADDVKIRVGGLPTHPQGPLNYKIVFQPDGLINEYVEPAVALRDGKKVELQCLTDIEELEFPPPFGKLEAFVTSGGASTLPDTMKDRVRNLDYKTIRYPGHAEKFRAVLSIGLGSLRPEKVGDVRIAPRALLNHMLLRAPELNYPDRDSVLVRVTATKGEKKVKYELVDLGEPRLGITAMMRTTAFPASTVAWMLGSGKVPKKGAYPQELCIPAEQFIREIRKRGVDVKLER
jgi:lysine 6-dehydrogenase